MKEVLISQLGPVLTAVVVAALIAIIKTIGDPLIELFLEVKAFITQLCKSTGHEEDLNNAMEVWGIVDEKFRITENATELFKSKEKLFEDLLLQRIPGLNQKEIDDLRDTIAGIVNKGRDALESKSDVSTQQIEDLKKLNDSLAAENQKYKEMFNRINSELMPNDNIQA